MSTPQSDVTVPQAPAAPVTKPRGQPQRPDNLPVVTETVSPPADQIGAGQDRRRDQ